uniref:DUF6420 family protein n=1 Tax=Streptomyces virginiae TaxID=1961 RepID=UPI002F91BD0D
MTAQDHGAAGPYIDYDGLPALRPTETGLLRLHPYGTVAIGRYLTPGGGRLTIQESGAHFEIKLDHLGCPAQLTETKNATFKRLGLAAEGHCLHAGCRHRATDTETVLRTFRLRNDSIDLNAFVRALLAIELGDSHPTDRLLTETEALAGPVRTSHT